MVGENRDGRGKFTWQGKGGQHTYDGDWRDGLKHGRGVYTWPSGGTYDGEWKDGNKDGWGVERCSSGGWYEGLCRGDTWTKGTWHNSNGVDVKEGEWVWDVSANTYKLQGWGVWRKGMIDLTGLGTYTEATESAAAKLDKAIVMVTVYEGEWNNNQMHGHGMWRLPGTGTIYCGELDHDVMSGTGRMLIGDNSTRYHDPGGSYVGGMKDDVFHGEGVRLWSNGDRYQGSWDDGKEHGNGTKRWARDGSSFTGVWERGVPVKGTMEWPNGDKFTGTFTDETEGEGVLSLSQLYCNYEGSAEFGNNGIKGSLRRNTFHGADGAALHVMGSSLPHLYHSQLIKKVKEEHNNERETERKQWNTERTQLQNKLNAAELSIKVATKLRSQLKNAAPLLISLEDSVSSLKQSLGSATERNQELAVHLSELANLREALDKAVEESETRCKEILGQTLTVESTESEIRQCSRNISLLMQKLLGIKPSSSANNEEQRGTRPNQDINKLMTLKPWLLLETLEQSPPSSSSALEPLSLLLRAITEGASRIQGGCTFNSCSKVIEQHTLFQKECDSQFTLCQGLHHEIGDLFSACQGLNEGYSRKYMVMRGLEGDESFMSHPDVWHQLSELLPRAQQVVMDITLAKFTSGKVPPGSQQQAGCTASGSASIPPRSTTETATNSSIHPQPQKQGGINITTLIASCAMRGHATSCSIHVATLSAVLSAHRT
ncbi:2-isopropylmalate synthase [Pelomyxa schiedti]|nr:2-isopropylmalate synthase [Pelomyxa schiedti]